MKTKTSYAIDFSHLDGLATGSVNEAVAAALRDFIEDNITTHTATIKYYGLPLHVNRWRVEELFMLDTDIPYDVDFGAMSHDDDDNGPPESGEIHVTCEPGEEPLAPQAEYHKPSSFLIDSMLSRHWACFLGAAVGAIGMYVIMKLGWIS